MAATIGVFLSAFSLSSLAIGERLETVSEDEDDDEDDVAVVPVMFEDG
jgi:hypothetical protein